MGTFSCRALLHSYCCVDYARALDVTQLRLFRLRRALKERLQDRCTSFNKELLWAREESFHRRGCLAWLLTSKCGIALALRTSFGVMESCICHDNPLRSACYHQFLCLPRKRARCKTRLRHIPPMLQATTAASSAVGKT